jgi:uncharacterized protein YjbJ (UPF0337 family)
MLLAESDWKAERDSRRLRWKASIPLKGVFTMDKDRIAGSAQQIKGKVKEAAGKALGDAKLESDGKAAGKIRNTVGGVKDAVREALDD